MYKTDKLEQRKVTYTRINKCNMNEIEIYKIRERKVEIAFFCIPLSFKCGKILCIIIE